MEHQFVRAQRNLISKYLLCTGDCGGPSQPLVSISYDLQPRVALGGGWNHSCQMLRAEGSKHCVASSSVATCRSPTTRAPSVPVKTALYELAHECAIASYFE